jgi:hypothetical protein
MNVNIAIVDTDENRAVGLTPEQFHFAKTGILRIRAEGDEEVVYVDVMGSDTYEDFVEYQLSMNAAATAQYEFLNQQIAHIEFSIADILRVTGLDHYIHYLILPYGELIVSVYSAAACNARNTIQWPQIAGYTMQMKPFMDHTGVALLYAKQSPTPPDSESPA